MFVYKDSIAIYLDQVHNRLLLGTKNAKLQSYSLTDFSLLSDIPAHNFAIYSISIACYSFLY